MRRVKPSSSNYRPHFADESSDTVYLTAHNCSSAASAPHWVKRHYRGYKCKIVSQDKLNELIK